MFPVTPFGLAVCRPSTLVTVCSLRRTTATPKRRTRSATGVPQRLEPGGRIPEHVAACEMKRSEMELADLWRWLDGRIEEEKAGTTFPRKGQEPRSPTKPISCGCAT
jgi:hypothetical protein